MILIQHQDIQVAIKIAKRTDIRSEFLKERDMLEEFGSFGHHLVKYFGWTQEALMKIIN